MENSLARHGRSFPHRGIRSTLDLGGLARLYSALTPGLRTRNSSCRGLGICPQACTAALQATYPVRYTLTRLEHLLDWPVLNRPQLAAFEVAAEVTPSRR